jgi:N-formylglutamate deformylase
MRSDIYEGQAMKDPTYHLEPGHSPLLISIPHLGSCLPPDLKHTFADAAAQTADADWHLDQLYDFSLQSGATMLSATVSRYVIDLNRPPDGASLYPGQTTSGLCPLETFRGEALYPPGGEPDIPEIRRRVERYWNPYHHELTRQIEAIKARHGFVLLWEAHSIAGELPRLFDGILPELNVGTFDGKSAAPAVGQAVYAAASTSGYTLALNGRFKGGYITRQYGNPARQIHAVQLEMSQRIYMEEFPPFNYRPDLAASVKPVLKQLLAAAAAAAEYSSK